MTIRTLVVYPNTFVDSVLQMSATRAMEDSNGVLWAAAAMGTPANSATLAERGFASDDLAPLKPNDLFVAVESQTDADSEQATSRAYAAMFEARPQTENDPSSERPPVDLDGAFLRQPTSSIAVVSVPGDYAALEAHKAIGRGLDVLLFSDNVSVEDERSLKDHAAKRGRLLMGPGAGTAQLGGVGLGFANKVRSGRVGIAAAAGTGAQEAMVLLHRWGLGVSQVIGLGGRDLSSDIGGRMASMALRALDEDPETDLILLVSKPPAPEVATALFSQPRTKPTVMAIMGSDHVGRHGDVLVADTLEGGVLRVLEVLAHAAPDVYETQGPDIAKAIQSLPEFRTKIQGLYSGGTLCYESLLLLERTFPEPVFSNTPLRKELSLPAPTDSSVLLDLGEEEYTKGRPHPMIDLQVRQEMLDDAAGDRTSAAVILDVVLGYGSHVDPAGGLAPYCERLHANSGPQVVAYVLGTDEDPQNYDEQVATLVDAGCIVTQTAARASLVAATLATRDTTAALMAL
ncbi:MAG: protein FdrA [Gammaproteobacteria bacterium]|nr:protein FdrA [Gammaproteobacteria bacterium]MCH9715640.1 protein FdrA [Gammaproteobacteria bacterium]